MQLKKVNGLKGKVFDNGYEVLKKHGLVIIWMSVGNSYFNKERIEEILEYAAKHFSVVRILIPYEPAIYTYLALGYDETKANSKARLGSNRLTNHTKRTISENASFQGKDIHILNWAEEVEKVDVYQKKLLFMTHLYETNRRFQIDAEETTAEVLSNKSDENISAEKIKIGVKYLLEELAFVLSSPDLFKVDKTAYMYHRHWPIYEKLVNGEYDDKPKEDIGFLLVEG
ncbi:MAG: tRNA-dependent cyclodipeptide synthase [Patescibacteria group bacterium]|jgi:cyclo(L-tyrosyl-L-tyrosyl) synthase